MFLKANRHGDKVQIGHDATLRLMGDIYVTLSADQKSEFDSWQEVQIMILQMQKEKNKN
jgi:hypothetical protein